MSRPGEQAGMDPDKFADKYNADAYLLPNHMQGWRSWRVGRLYPSLLSWRRYRLFSYAGEYIWKPNESIKASCRVVWSQEHYYQRGVHPSARFIIYPLLALISLIALLVGIIGTMLGKVANPFQIFQEQGFIITFSVVLFLWILIIIVYGLPALVQRRMRRKPERYGHDAPVDSCTCGLYANPTLEDLENELIRMQGFTQWQFSPKDSRWPLKRNAYVISEITTTGHNTRVMSGSIGFRASEMAICGETFYLIAGTPKMAAALKRIYGKHVVMGYPPAFTKLREE